MLSITYDETVSIQESIDRKCSSIVHHYPYFCDYCKCIDTCTSHLTFKHLPDVLILFGTHFRPPRQVEQTIVLKETSDDDEKPIEYNLVSAYLQVCHNLCHALAVIVKSPHICLVYDNHWEPKEMDFEKLMTSSATPCLTLDASGKDVKIFYRMFVYVRSREMTQKTLETIPPDRIVRECSPPCDDKKFIQFLIRKYNTRMSETQIIQFSMMIRHVKKPNIMSFIETARSLDGI